MLRGLKQIKTIIRRQQQHTMGSLVVIVRPGGGGGRLPRLVPILLLLSVGLLPLGDDGGGLGDGDNSLDLIDSLLHSSGAAAVTACRVREVADLINK